MKSPRVEPQPQPADAPPLKSTKNQTHATRNKVPRQEHRIVSREKLFRPMLDIVRDGVHERTRGNKERCIEAVERNVRDEPAIPEREHEQQDQCAVNDH